VADTIGLVNRTIFLIRRTIIGRLVIGRFRQRIGRLSED
jgi:hypothetical protein